MYKPSQEILDKYADLLINFALGGCVGIKKGEVVFLQVHECAKPILLSLRRAVLKSGGFPLIQYIPDGIAKEFFDLANDSQITFFPKKFLKGRIDEIDHSVFIESDVDPFELKGVDPEKIMRSSKAYKPYMEWRDKKENEGKFTWTLALYGTEAMAKEAGLTIEEYWDQIIKACYLDLEDPRKRWKEITSEIERLKKKLDDLKIEKLHIKSENVDLTIGIGKNRKWMGGSGRNIPSFEVYITPDYRLTEGKIKFDMPLYRYGNLVKGISLEFKNGEVVDAKAEEGEEIIKEMIKSDEGAKRVGEFSLTDKRFSRIDRFMATTLFDENFGGKYGNTHIALGKAYQDSYPGDPSKVEKERWKEMGYNESVVHTDIISTENRTVTAFLEDGRELVIYRDGEFVI